MVDDHRMFLEGLSSIFLDVEEICVLDSLTDGKQAVDYLSSHQVDVVVTDINMPKMDGIALNLEIKKKWPSIKTLVLSTHSDPETIQKVYKCVQKMSTAVATCWTFSARCNVLVKSRHSHALTFPVGQHIKLADGRFKKYA